MLETVRADEESAVMVGRGPVLDGGRCRPSSLVSPSPTLDHIRPPPTRCSPPPTSKNLPDPSSTPLPPSYPSFLDQAWLDLTREGRSRRRPLPPRPT